jgi:hypothetical protein
MAISNIFNLRWLGIPYMPQPDERSFLDRAVVQKDDDLALRVAVLDDRESQRFFGVSLARRGIQPVWLEITNLSRQAFRLRLASLDPGYYPPLEAALVNHFRIVRRILGFGLIACVSLPLLPLLPFKLIGAGIANRKMDTFFLEHGIGCGLIKPGGKLSGFVFTALDEGTKQFSIRLLGASDEKGFPFSIPVPGLKVDYHRKQFEVLGNHAEAIECAETELRQRLEKLPRATTNKPGTLEGDPLNLVVIGEFDTILKAFGARWDETEIITLSSCLRTFRAFMLHGRYRYSPVSALYVSGRSQDFALQRARQTINQRLHLRLWITPLRFQEKPVWIGQISRDIGVRFTPKTWNLTTHKIDPNVDDARDYLLDDLMEGGHLALAGYVPGAAAADRTAPRRNLTGDPYFTDGLRAVAMFSETRTTAKFVYWT